MGIHENKWVKLLTFLWTHKTGLFIRTVAEAGLLPCGRSPEIGSWEHLAGRCASQASQTFSPRWVSQESKALLCHVCTLITCIPSPFFSECSPQETKRETVFLHDTGPVLGLLRLSPSAKHSVYQWEPLFGAQMREKRGLIWYLLCTIYVWERRESISAAFKDKNFSMCFPPPSAQCCF